MIVTVEQLAGLRDERLKTLTARASKGARQDSASVWRGLWISALFVVLMVATLALVALMTIGKVRDGTAVVAKVAPGMIARVSRPTQDGVLCVTTTYNNASAEFTKDKVERCDGNAVSKSRSRSMLNWYGK